MLHHIGSNGKTLCGLNCDGATASDGGYVHPSVQGLSFCCGMYVSYYGSTGYLLDSLKQNPDVRQECIAEIEKQKLF
jgi:hypothetical protein